MKLADDIDEKEFVDSEYLKEWEEESPVSASDLSKVSELSEFSELPGLSRLSAPPSSEISKNSRKARMYKVLQQYFGYSSFRPLQEKIIKDVLDRKDVFVLMPTGGGKSLCYQLPALLQEGVTVVVSPLISLMKDQVDGLEASGIAAACMNSTMKAKEIRDVKVAFLENRIKILYVAPERLMMPSTLSLLKRGKVSLFAIDEAHCISEWGHDFRPEYRKLKLLRDSIRGFSEVPVIALTATATERVRKDIISQLKLSLDPKTGPYVASFNRENLYYEVRPKKETFSEISDYLRQHRGEAGIIYCQSRNNVEALTAKLLRAGFRTLPYHAGLNDSERARNQDRFLKDDVDIIVATIAFGMGIDKSNVRFVIHYDLPRNLESYYQETGRGGRDGGPCECILFFSRGDRFKIEYFIQQKENEKEKDLALVQLRQMVAYCESRQCRRKILLEYFGEQTTGNCRNCDSCLYPKATFNGTEAAKKLLTCVQELKQRFGTNYVIDVLYGSRNKKIKANRHDHLKTHGSGREFTKDQWKALVSEMTSSGILEVRGARYPLLKLNAKSRKILRGKERVELAQPPGYSIEKAGKEYGKALENRKERIKFGTISSKDFENSENSTNLKGAKAENTARKNPEGSGISELEPSSSIQKSGLKASPQQTDAGYDPLLFERLRRLRKEIALKKNLPPYIIFSDTSLREMAEKSPKTQEEFHQITGVGDHKLRKYGAQFLQEIANYRKESRAFTKSSIPEKKVQRVPAPESTTPEKPGTEAIEKTRPVPEIKRRYLDTSIQDWSSQPKLPNLRGKQSLSLRSFESEASLDKIYSLSKQSLGIYEIADLSGQSPKTVCKQLEKLILAGKLKQIDELVSPGKQQRIKKAITEIEEEFYARIFQKMKGSCSKEEIRLVRALLFMQAED